MKELSFRERAIYQRQMQDEVFDLVIIGGGINGAGVARDASSRGMKVCVIEANDFASGTSSRSSKLIHGGIRYLENYEFSLVFEALSERQNLFEMAPHLVHPLRFMIPVYEGGRVGMNRLGLGMWAYDALSLFRAPEMHERLNAGETLQRQATLQAKGLQGSFVYSDAYMDDDRLVLETLRSAHEFGAVCANYVKATGVVLDENSKVKKVKAKDQLSGAQFEIEGKHFVSTVGPWTDEFGQSILKNWKNILRPTKGSHLTFLKKKLPLSSAVVMAAESRIVFAIPRHEMVIVGTTDTDFQGSLEDITASSEDVDYLLMVTDKYFPGAQLGKKDILSSYAGVRPLVQDGASTEGKTSREHKIWTEDNGVTFIAGGKYTTYRKIAEDVVNECLHHFRLEEKVKFNHSRTLQPLNPLVTSDALVTVDDTRYKLREDMQLADKDIDILVSRHGPEALEICRQFGGKRNFLQYEAMHALHSTMCLNLVDFYARRVPLYLADPDHGLSSLEELALIFQSALGWSNEETKLQKQKVLDHLAHELAWKG